MFYRFSIASAFVVLFVASSMVTVFAQAPATQDAATEPPTPQLKGAELKASELKTSELGATRNVHSFNQHLLCGQPSAADFAEAKRRGIGTVITFRERGEIDWDEAAVLKNLGIDFHEIPFAKFDSLTDNVFDEAVDLMKKKRDSGVMMHCGSANRVGAIWIVHRVINDGIAVDAAVKESKEVGLRVDAYQKKALDYIKRKQEASPRGKPSINDRFKDANLDVNEWIGRFEVESREVFAAKDKVLAICDIEPGATVADVGAGTGFYSRLFSSAVGKDGWVYSVDIAPGFLKHINTKAAEEKITNLTTVLCTDRAVSLPPKSVDLVFICDTYHHFEHHESTLASIHRALKPGGTLVVIDFERIVGKSRKFLIGHVRAGKEVFQGEIIEAGFRFVEEIDVPEFKENYLLRFRKEK